MEYETTYDKKVFFLDGDDEKSISTPHFRAHRSARQHLETCVTKKPDNGPYPSHEEIAND